METKIGTAKVWASLWGTKEAYYLEQMQVGIYIKKCDISKNMIENSEVKQM